MPALTQKGRGIFPGFMVGLGERGSSCFLGEKGEQGKDRQERVSEVLLLSPFPRVQSVQHIKAPHQRVTLPELHGSEKSFKLE